MKQNDTDVHAGGKSGTRIPLNTFAIGLGLAGLAEIWSVASGLLGIPSAIGTSLWVVVVIAWVWLMVAHTWRGARSGDRLIDQLRHPAQGPIAAIMPIVGMLLGSRLYPLWPIGGTVLVLASIAAATLFAAWHLGFLMSGGLKPEALHGAYFLPTVAASFVAGTTSATIGFHELAVAAFSVGILFWVVIFGILMARLAFLPPLPAPLTPTLAIILAPPAVGGSAWFAIMGERDDPVSVALLGLTVLMLLLQLAWLPRYRALPFSLGFWSFSFPFAATGTYGIQWLAIAGFAGWQLAAVVLLAAVTVLIGGIAVRSLVLVGSQRRAVRRAEDQLRRADDYIEKGERAPERVA